MWRRAVSQFNLDDPQRQSRLRCLSLVSFGRYQLLSGGSLTLIDEWNEVEVCLSEKTLREVSPYPSNIKPELTLYISLWNSF